MSGLCGEGHQCPELERTWAERPQHPGTWLASPDASTTTLESLQLERVRARASEWGCDSGGQRRDLSLCSRLGRDWALDRRTHQTRTLSSDIPCPCRACHFSSHFCHHQRQEVGLSSSPTHLPSEPGTPWVVPGAEPEALTGSHLRPITCAATGSGPRSEGPRDHVGEGRKVHSWTSSPASLGQKTAQHWPSAGRTDAQSQAAALQMGAVSACPIIVPHPSRFLSALQTQFCVLTSVGCFIYCLNTLF